MRAGVPLDFCVVEDTLWVAVGSPPPAKQQRNLFLAPSFANRTQDAKALTLRTLVSSTGTQPPKYQVWQPAGPPRNVSASSKAQFCLRKGQVFV